MCAICGVFDREALDSRTAVPTVEAMGEAMRHRGPDDAGIYHDRSAALGVRRLSVIDVAGGHQPISNEDRTVWVALNGELYNHEALRRELEGKGHRFATRSDTEVAVHLYEQEGDGFVERLRGMFAIAVWDASRRRLVLARDRLGIKPLYYTQRGTALWFASELTALLTHPDIPRELDRTALDQYLCHGYIPSPRTMIAGILKLPPAHRLVSDAAGVRLTRYWRLPTDQIPVTADEACERFRALLRDSVRLHLRSDVPVGVWLSGGLDSSAVAAAARQAGQPLPAFTIGFDEPSFDETGPAKAAAAALGLPHTVASLTAHETEGLLDTALGACDEPLGDASLVATYALSQLTRRHVTVALSGDGGDELFGGYPTYYAHRAAQLYNRLPRPLRRRIIQPLAERLPVSHSNMSLDFVARRFLRGAGQAFAERHATWMGAFDHEEREALWASDARPAARGDLWGEAAAHGGGTLDAADEAMRLDLTTYLPDDLLVKVDRMSMAHGLEVRVPFLDHTIVEFAVRLPAALKVRGTTTKWLLRRALKGRLPAHLLRRSKKGFGIPVGAWLNGRLRPRLHDLLSERRLQRHGLWDQAYVARLLDQHGRGTHNYGRQLWTLLCFEWWCDRHLQEPAGALPGA